jgi:hypothetical protein
LHSALSPTAPGLAVSFDVHEELDAQHALLSPSAPGLADLLLLLQPFTRLMTAHSATMLRIDLIMVLTSSVRPAIAGKRVECDPATMAGPLIVPAQPVPGVNYFDRIANRFIYSRLAQDLRSIQNAPP